MRWAVGIDLGTTHSVVAACPMARGASPDVVPIVQRVTLTEEAERPLLASALYAPIEGEVSTGEAWIVGEAAARRSSEVSGRTVTSAKSWLAHASVDRRAPILPWGVDDPSMPRLSPVDAAALTLEALVRSLRRARPEATLDGADLALTVPASFDEDARALTLEAARREGLEPMLVEEPQAAFLAALDERATGELLAGGRSSREVLVVDVGGGTTDIVLLRVARDRERGVVFERVATGRHLLVGGDNMDLALAHLAERRMTTEGRLDAARFAQLTQACRRAKERLLAGAAARETVSVLGRGSRLVGGAWKAELERADVERVVLDGFFPDVTLASPLEGAKGGLVALGLPYERDVAITRHVVAFLRRHGLDAPDAVLLNGGVFLGAPILARVRRVLEALRGGPVTLVENRAPDTAVAVGAALSVLAAHGHARAVARSSGRGYYVAVDPPEATERRAVCILPRGSEVDEVCAATRHELLLVGGGRRRFDLFSSDVHRAEAGELTRLDPARFDALPALTADVPRGERDELLRVHLEARLTRQGTVAMAFREIARPRVLHELAFERALARADTPESLAPNAGGEGAASEVVTALVDSVFGKKASADPSLAKGLIDDLERAAGARTTWSLATCRVVADALLERAAGRRRSADHERVYFSLVGYALRPGFGKAGDEARAARFASLLDARLAFPAEVRGWQQLFVAWRRVAGGMTREDQLRLRDAFDGVVAPASAGIKAPKRAPEAVEELIVALGSLERVPSDRKSALGDWLVERSYRRTTSTLWTAVGRLGARVPLYAGPAHALPPEVVEPWLVSLVRARWDEIASAPHAAVQMARRTGDRARDVGEGIRRDVLKKLEASGARAEWIVAVRDVVELDEGERARVFGEALPMGLAIAGDAL